MNDPVTETATEYSSGAMLVWADNPYVPLRERVLSRLQIGERVWQRKVIVVEGWEKVPSEKYSAKER